jgi:hypothetical protein
MCKAPLGDVLDKKEAESYHQCVGALLWLANMTRPDLAYAAGYPAWYLQVLTSALNGFLKHTLAHINFTSDCLLTLGRQNDDSLTGYVDK